MRAVVAVLAMFLLLPAAAAQDVGIQNPDSPSPVTLFFHMDAHQDFPINTQPPDDRYAAAHSLGLSAATTSCVPDGGGALNQVSKSFHTFYGFSTPGYVEYNIQEDGGPRIHPERGLATDVRLDTGSTPTLFWYLQTKATGGDPRFGAVEDVENVPVLIPNVVVRATMRTGDEVSIGASAYNTGELVMQGQSEPQTLFPELATGYIPQDDGSHVYEFQVPMEHMGSGTIPNDEAFNMRVDILMEMPGCVDDPDASIMPPNVRVFTSPELRPRLDLSILNPVAIEYIHPQFIGRELLIHAGFSSPWGNYDVDEGPGGVEFTITGPSAAKSLTRAAVVQRFHEHGYHFEPVDITYVWPYALDQASEGEYIIEVVARNDQHSGEASGTALVEIGRNRVVDSDGNEAFGTGTESEGSPAISVVLAVALLAAAVVWRRRGVR